ncbi:MAG: hypothetical protein KGL39_53815, partial [Patescibacteria group bacterium]|nr:hypothetical protein [Patescibacteria group bacterium]
QDRHPGRVIPEPHDDLRADPRGRDAVTYLHTVAVALDDLGASLLFNLDDTTISALCGVQRRADAGDARASGALATLHLRPWQHAFLRVVGRLLEWIKPGHCERAIAADLARGRTMRGILG